MHIRATHPQLIIECGPLEEGVRGEPSAGSMRRLLHKCTGEASVSETDAAYLVEAARRSPSSPLRRSRSLSLSLAFSLSRSLSRWLSRSRSRFSHPRALALCPSLSLSAFLLSSAPDLSLYLARSIPRSLSRTLSLSLAHSCTRAPPPTLPLLRLPLPLLLPSSLRPLTMFVGVRLVTGSR